MNIKIWIGTNLTTFSDKTLFFEPESSIERADYNRNTRTISFATATKEHSFLVEDHVGPSRTSGILHVQALKYLVSDYPEYFAKVLTEASENQLNTFNTFVYEMPRPELFPTDPDKFVENIAPGAGVAKEYEKLHEMPGYRMYIQDYLSRMTTRETLPMAVQFCNSLSKTNLKTFLISHLADKHKRWAIPLT